MKEEEKIQRDDEYREEKRGVTEKGFVVHDRL